MYWLNLSEQFLHFAKRTAKIATPTAALPCEVPSAKSKMRSSLCLLPTPSFSWAWRHSDSDDIVDIFSCFSTVPGFSLSPKMDRNLDVKSRPDRASDTDSASIPPTSLAIL